MQRDLFLRRGGRYHEWYVRRMDGFLARADHWNRDADPRMQELLASGEEDLTTLKAFGAPRRSHLRAARLKGGVDEVSAPACGVALSVAGGGPPDYGSMKP